MWNFPGPGMEPMSFALAGGFLPAEPPVKSDLEEFEFLYFNNWSHWIWVKKGYSLFLDPCSILDAWWDLSPKCLEIPRAFVFFSFYLPPQTSLDKYMVNWVGIEWWLYVETLTWHLETQTPLSENITKARLWGRNTIIWVLLQKKL